MAACTAASLVLACLALASAAPPVLPQALAALNGAAGDYHRLSTGVGCSAALSLRADWTDPGPRKVQKAHLPAPGPRASVWQGTVQCGEYAVHCVRNGTGGDLHDVDTGELMKVREHIAVGKVWMGPQCTVGATGAVGGMGRGRRVVFATARLVVSIPEGVEGLKELQKGVEASGASRVLVLAGKEECVYVDKIPGGSVGKVGGRGLIGAVGGLLRVTGDSSAADPSTVQSMNGMGSDGDDDTVDKRTSDSEPRAATTTEESNCFSAKGTVQLRDGQRVTMDRLRVGDEVLAAPGVYSKVFLFTHRARDTEATFIKVIAQAARVSNCGLTPNACTRESSELLLTPGHFIYTSRGLVPSVSLIAGDTLLRGDGTRAVVRSVSLVRATGVYNPHTLHGDIVVNGIVTSTYTTAVHPLLAHALLLPLRIVFAAAGFSTAQLEQNGAMSALAPGSMYSPVWLARAATSGLDVLAV